MAAMLSLPAVERGQKQDNVVVLDDALLLAAESAKSECKDGWNGREHKVSQTNALKPNRTTSHGESGWPPVRFQVI